MESMIEQLWEGTVCVSKEFRKQQDFDMRCAKIHAFVSRLAPTMTEEQRAGLTQLLKCRDELEEEAVREAFAQGYKTGVRVAAEAFLEK